MCRLSTCTHTAHHVTCSAAFSTSIYLVPLQTCSVTGVFHVTQASAEASRDVSESPAGERNAAQLQTPWQCCPDGKWLRPAVQPPPQPCTQHAPPVQCTWLWQSGVPLCFTDLYMHGNCQHPGVLQHLCVLERRVHKHVMMAGKCYTHLQS